MFRNQKKLKPSIFYSSFIFKNISSHNFLLSLSLCTFSRYFHFLFFCFISSLYFLPLFLSLLPYYTYSNFLSNFLSTFYGFFSPYFLIIFSLTSFSLYSLTTFSLEFLTLLLCFLFLFYALLFFTTFSLYFLELLSP